MWSVTTVFYVYKHFSKKFKFDFKFNKFYEMKKKLNDFFKEEMWNIK